MDKHEYQSEFARKYFAQGREEGREEGLRDACRALLAAKLRAVPADIAARLAATSDLKRLEAFLVDLGTAQDAEAVHAAIAAHLR